MTDDVSMSELGPCAPRQYNPNVKISPLAVSATASERPQANDMVLTKDLTRVSRQPSMISLVRK